MLTKMHYRLNTNTELDYLLFFSHYLFEESEAKDMVQRCMPWIYFMSVNYTLARNLEPAAIALAAMCFEMQMLSEDMQEQRDQLLLFLDEVNRGDVLQ